MSVAREAVSWPRAWERLRSASATADELGVQLSPVSTKTSSFAYSKGRNYKKTVDIREIRRTLQPLKYLGTPSEHPRHDLSALGIYTWQQIFKTPLCVNRVCNICSKAYVKPQLTPAGSLLVTSGQNLEAPWDFSYQRGKRERFRKRLPVNVDNVSTRIFVSMLWKPQLYRILPHNPRTG